VELAAKRSKQAVSNRSSRTLRARTDVVVVACRLCLADVQRTPSTKRDSRIDSE